MSFAKPAAASDLQRRSPWRGLQGPGAAISRPTAPASPPFQPQPRRMALVSMAASKPWRPTIDDVDSISRGGPAKVRGTGSRRIPHRLNAEERTLYDLAKKKGFLAVRGTAYRKFRHGNPLPNIFRQWCDARGHLCVVVEQDPLGAGGVDRVVVDLAPLRAEDTLQAELALAELAAEAGLRRVPYDERPPDALPFNILPPNEDDAAEAEEEQIEQPAAAAVAAASGKPEAEPEAAARSSGSSEASSSGGGGGAGVSEPEKLAVLRRAVAAQAEAVRRLKAQGRTNKDPDVQDQVRVLQELKASLAHAEAARAALAEASSHDPDPAAPPAPPPPPPSMPSHASPQDRQPTATATAATSEAAGMSSDDAGTGSASTTGGGGGVAPPGGSCPPPAPRRSPLEHYYRLPIWQINAVPLFFEGSRTAAKQFAGQAVHCVLAAEAEAARRMPSAAAAAAEAAPAEALRL